MLKFHSKISFHHNENNKLSTYISKRIDMIVIIKCPLIYHNSNKSDYKRFEIYLLILLLAKNGKILLWLLSVNKFLLFVFNGAMAELVEHQSHNFVSPSSNPGCVMVICAWICALCCCRLISCRALSVMIMKLKYVVTESNGEKIAISKKRLWFW